MIVLDTHIWVRWVHDSDDLKPHQRDAIDNGDTGIIAVSAVSCWEIAKLVQLGRLDLRTDIDSWFVEALDYSGVDLLELTPEVAIESTRLPGLFHTDPFDQIIVATARLFNCPLVTSDRKILAYPHVTTI